MVLDRHLDFHIHLDKVENASNGLQAISSLGRSKWGLAVKEKRMIYNMCIAPLALYDSSVRQYPRLHGRKKAHDKQVQVLTAIQRRAGHIVTGAFQRVSCCTRPPVSRQAYMGRETTDTVPAAELAGIVLARAREDPRFYEAVEVYTDNQSALRSLQRPSQTSGRMLGHGSTGSPAHMGVLGNEFAYDQAKRPQDGDLCAAVDEGARQRP
ncbi:hypothetical protein EYZ11_012636 [Aspergillus tanneri]|uniref:RNase H type-1 domain-containing protein n=1 Tax=Aspergillus tanneri TaxID=1220188 RepID=A0A4S3IZZ3_9EURO|nr:hypothetical protein EYZ11_012636 [Aspergillus tanneri]